MLALDADELDTEQLKWVVLMVLSSQPGQEQAFARMEDLVSDGAPPCAALSRSARHASIRSAARPRFFVFRHERFS